MEYCMWTFMGCLMRSLCQVVIKPDLDVEHKGLIASLPHELRLDISTMIIFVKILIQPTSTNVYGGIIYVLCSCPL